MASPIEDSLYRGIIAALPPRFQIWEVDQESFEHDDLDRAKVHGPPTSDDDIVWMVREYRVNSYRVDFMLAFYGQVDRRLAIECDGHDFHDRTKQQAAYDRSRDRELFREGIYTLRFTGSEIHHSIERCSSDVFGALGHLRSLNDRFRDGWTACAEMRRT